MSVVKKGPDVSEAAKVGEPTLVDPTPVSANQMAAETMREALGLSTTEKGQKSVTLETVKAGAPGANEPAPRSTSQLPLLPMPIPLPSPRPPIPTN